MSFPQILWLFTLLDITKHYERVFLVIQCYLKIKKQELEEEVVKLWSFSGFSHYNGSRTCIRIGLWVITLIFASLTLEQDPAQIHNSGYLLLGNKSSSASEIDFHTMQFFVLLDLRALSGTILLFENKVTERVFQEY